MLCDVVEMDACHILLGRPWLFDKKSHHDGKAKTYEFKKDGQQYKLTPMLENTVQTTNTCGETSIMLYPQQPPLKFDHLMGKF